MRFEMPFAVWCHTCHPHAIIGQGVRFNARKRKVGHYLSTPIWAFTIKHAACGGHVEIRTDPKNTQYEVTEGGRARDYGDDEVREGEDGIPILTPHEKERRREDAFAMLEGKEDDKEVMLEGKRRIDELYDARGRDWKDPWAVNRRMRDEFRKDRKIRKREEAKTDAIKRKFGTDIDLLPESREDEERAKLVTFGDLDARSGDDLASSKAIFASRHSTTRRRNANDPVAILRQKVRQNTRALQNPFG